MVEAPVSLFIFNRPRETAKVLEALRRVQPKRLLVHGDGPRPDRSEDEAKVHEVRALIDTVDWDCEVVRNYSDRNMGSFGRSTSGLDFAFERYETCIVLDDDCVPDPTFFSYCDELLQRFLHDERISVIGGFSNIHRPEHPYSYFFSRYPMSWGWATWRRMWKLVDLNMPCWPEMKAGGLTGVLPEGWIRKEWIRLYDSIYTKKLKNGWDYQLQLAGWANNMLTIVPNVNLVENIGFGSDATHTQDSTSGNANLKSCPLQLPLRHPQSVFRDTDADELIEKVHFERNVPRILLRQQVEAVLDRFKRPT